MSVIATVAEMQTWRDHATGTVGLVPTMGFLHEGHLSLVRRARADCRHVVVSIFVNPTQFGPNEDLDRYPRDTDRDLRLLEAEGADAVFLPSVHEIYPPGFDDWVEVRGPLTERLEAEHRPGHFRGVTTVVARLFRMIRPHKAYFGQKDAQQLRVVRKMVANLILPIEIIPMPIVREPDGLAMSSRNVYLSPTEREAALAIPHALALARRLIMDDGVTDAAAARQAIRDAILRGVGQKEEVGSPEDLASDESRPRLDLEYVSISDEQTLEELETIDRPALVLLAAHAGQTRLIDNTIVVPRGTAVPDHLLPLLDEHTSHRASS